MDRLDTLEAFVITVDRGSLSAAARATGRSITAISRALTELEARLGVQLLVRTTRALKLTEAGARYLEVSRRVLSELAHAERTESAALESPQGLLTVTAPLMFGSMHVRPLVDAYLAAYPDVRARLLLLDRVVSVVDEGVDVALRIAHLPDSALVASLLGRVRRVVCASPDYLARHGRPREPRDLVEHRCIAFNVLTPTDTWSFGAGPEGGRIKQVKLSPVLSVNTAEAAIASATAGHGITSALSYQIAAAVRQGSLVPLLTHYEPEALPVHLVHPARTTRAAKVRAFMELAVPKLRALLSEEPGPRTKTKRRG